MPVDRLYQGNEPIPHPITGELIALDDRESLFRAWTDGENAIRRERAKVSEHSGNIREIREQCDRIVYALAGKDVTLPAARGWSRDQIDQGC